MNPRLILWIAGITGVAFAFLGAWRPLLLDELHTAYLASHGYAQAIEWLKPDSGVFLFHFLLTTWMALFGSSEAAIHGLTGVLYLLTACAVYRLGLAANLSRTGAAMAALLFVISPQAFRLAHYGRPYTLLALLVTLSALCFCRLFGHEEKRKVWTILYVIVNVAGTFTHYWFAFVLFGQSVAVLLLWRRRIVFLITLLAASALPFVVLWVPVILAQQIGNGAMKWLPRPGLLELGNTFLGYFGRGWTGWPAYLVLAAAAAWKWNAEAWSAWRKNSLLLGLAIVMALTLFVPFVLSQWKPVYLPGRYTIAALPPFVVLAAAWLSALARPKAQRLAVAALWILGVSGYAVYALRPPLENNRPAAEFLRDRLQSGDQVVFTGMSRLGVQYYWDRTATAAELPASVFPSEMLLHRSWIDSTALLENERPRMEREAGFLLEKLRSQVPAGRSVWLFRGYDTALNVLLEDGFASHGFVLRDRTPFSGSHYTHIWRYEKTP